MEACFAELYSFNKDICSFILGCMVNSFSSFKIQGKCHPSILCPSIHLSIQKYSLKTYYVPGTVLETEDPGWKQTQSPDSCSL